MMRWEGTDKLGKISLKSFVEMLIVGKNIQRSIDAKLHSKIALNMQSLQCFYMISINRQTV